MTPSSAEIAMLHCHIVVGQELPEPLCQLVARHLTEVIAETFRTPVRYVVIRVDVAPPARYFIGGHLHEHLASCLVTLIYPPSKAASAREFTTQALRFLRETFGSTVLESQIRVIEMMQKNSALATALNNSDHDPDNRASNAAPRPSRFHS